MKRLIYSLFALLVLSSCISKEERAVSETLVKSVIQAYQKNDTTAFHALFLTEPEFIQMGLDGQKIKKEEERTLGKEDLVVAWQSMDMNVNQCYSDLKQAAEKQGINWANAQLASIDKVKQFTSIGVEIWRIKATIKSGEKTFEFKVCDAHMMPDGKLKLVQVRKYNQEQK
ncbi:hypothetical protein [Parabacteroides sp. FAFU027]|uniref:hypothetical protein n=1 Tax=Parabacteroides sp. FAFU027 TaxID=2922715 RepID=UPI001FAE8520|nr:hypothetical protein [Parabacteroides sp. FAFU027]